MSFPEPETSEEWQQVVDVAHACLALDAAQKYGLVERRAYGGIEDGAIIEGSGVRTERCEEVLARGAELGYKPRDDAIERFIQAWDDLL